MNKNLQSSADNHLWKTYQKTASRRGGGDFFDSHCRMLGLLAVSRWRKCDVGISVNAMHTDHVTTSGGSFEHLYLIILANAEPPLQRNNG